MTELEKDNKNGIDKFRKCNVFPVVSSEVQTGSYKFAGGQEKVGNGVYPICAEDLRKLQSGEMSPIPYEIREERENDILIRHPFRPYELIPLSTPEEIIMKDHLHDLAVIFAALGAEDAQETVTIEEQQTCVIKGDGTFKVKTIKANGDFRQTKDEKKDANLELHIVRQSGKDAGYQKAYNLAKKLHLLETHEIKEILRQFDPEIGGKNYQYILNEELSSTYHETINAALQVNASNVFDFKGFFHKDIEKRRKLRIKLDVKLNQNILNT